MSAPGYVLFDKRILFAAFSFVAVQVLIAPTAFAADVIKIGFMPALSGVFQQDSVGEIKAAKLGIKEINDAGGINGKKLELVIVDNKSTPQGASEAFQQLIEKEKVTAVIGTSKSIQITAIGPASKKSRIPVFIGATNPLLLSDPENTFVRLRPDDNVAAFGVSKYVRTETQFKKIALLHDAGSNGVSQANNLEKYIRQASDLKIVSRLSYPTATTEFKKFLEELKKAGAEIMIFNGGAGQDAGLMMKQFKEYSSAIKYLGNATSLRANALQIAGKDNNGYWIVAEYACGSAEVKKFSESFKKEYGENIDPFSLWAYDATKLLAIGLREGGGASDKIRPSILKLQNYNGLMGKLKFDAFGNGAHSITIVKALDGELLPVKTIDVDKIE